MLYNNFIVHNKVYDKVYKYIIIKHIKYIIIVYNKFEVICFMKGCVMWYARSTLLMSVLSSKIILGGSVYSWTSYLRKVNTQENIKI